MNLTSVTTWIKNNLMISIIVGLVAIFLFFPRMFKGIIGSSPRRRRRRIIRSSHSRRVHHAITGTHRRRVRRSSPVRHRTVRRKMKGSKKPWQVKGSLAARRHMALIRKRR
jgi:hypothetical protein